MQKNKRRRPGIFNRKRFYKKILLSAFPILIGSILLTIFITFYSYRILESRAGNEFMSIGNEIKNELIDRLEDHALMLRAGIAYFTLASPVSRAEWKEYVIHSRIDRYLPGVQGMGYAVLIPPDQLEQHTEEVRNEGFSDYAVFPSYPRDIYTSIVFVEPFAGRNLKAFGYDMFTEPTRRRAMENARDFDVAFLSGRVLLQQDTGGEEMYGTFMYVPFFEPNTPVSTVEQRRNAIRGWLYSPYRLNTLMQDIYNYYPQEVPVRAQIYDEAITDSTIIYDSQRIGTRNSSEILTRNYILPIDFNRNRWYLNFTQPREFPFRVIIIFCIGLILNLMLYVMIRMAAKIESRSNQIKAQNKKLKTLNATKDKFFSIIAHDLKSPYNAVLGFSDILLTQSENLDRQEIKSIADMIKRSADVAVNLLTNLMVWSQSQTNRIKFNPEVLDLTDIVSHVILLYNETALQKGISLSFDLPENSTVTGDREMLDTILRNLVSNAIKFTRPGGKIIVSAVKDEYETIVSVADNGIGISKENKKKLFRIDEGYTTAGTEKEKGTGLGLILCLEFVEKHGGRIWVESTPGKGTIFSFSIPFLK